MAEREIRIPIVGDSSQLKRELDKAARELDGFGGNAKKLATNFNREFLLLGGGIAAGLGIAVKTAMDFDKQMSEVGATSGAVGDELNKLREAAIQAGAATVFNAQEAAAAESELAKAGLQVSDILGGGLKGALDLAAAGSLGVADAAEIAAQSMAQFKLSGSDVPRIADALAAGANKALGGVEDLGQGLGEAGGVANTFGLSLEETTGVLALFAQNGQLGAEGGTALKTALLRLGAPTSEAKRAMDELGLSFYDANGQFVGISDAAEQLKTKMAGLTEEQRNQALQTIFGNRAIKGATILYEAGGAGVDQWTTAVSDAGYASQLAGQKTDNLAGDLEQLRGSLETALIQGGSQATDALRGMAQGLTSVVNGLGAMPGPLQTAFLGSSGLLGVGALGIGIYGSLAPKIDKVKQSLEGMGGVAGSVGRNLGGIGAATAGITVGLGLVSYAMGEAQKRQEQFNEGVDRFVSAMKDAGGATDEFNKSIRQAFVDADIGAELSKIKDAGVDLGVFTDAVRNSGTELDALGKLVGKVGFEDELKKAAESGQQFAIVLRQLQDDGVLSAGEVEKLAGKFDYLNDQVDTAAQDLDVQNQIVGDLTDSAGDASSAVGDLATSQQDAAAAAEEHTRELEAQYTAITTLAGGDVALKQAQIAAREELQSYNDTMADATASADDREKAGLDLINAFLREADAAVGLARDQAEAADGQLSAAEAARIQREKLEELRDTLAPGNPLRQQLQGYIDKLYEVPDERTTYLNAVADEAKRKVQELLDKIREIPLNTRFEINGNVATSYSFGAGNIVPGALANGRAFGGPVYAGTTVPVGEHGKEYFTPAVDGWVMNGSTPPPMSGGNTTVLQFTGPINLPNVTDPDSFVNALQKWVKVNGPLPVPVAA